MRMRPTRQNVPKDRNAKRVRGRPRDAAVECITRARVACGREQAIVRPRRLWLRARAAGRGVRVWVVPLRTRRRKRSGSMLAENIGRESVEPRRHGLYVSGVERVGARGCGGRETVEDGAILMDLRLDKRVEGAEFRNEPWVYGGAVGRAEPGERVPVGGRKRRMSRGVGESGQRW